MFAIRAQVHSHGTFGISLNDYLIKGVPLQKITPDDLEEVEFTGWPPSMKEDRRTFFADVEGHEGKKYQLHMVCNNEREALEFAKTLLWDSRDQITKIY